MTKINRRHIQVILGFLWLLDGFLQLQSKMFTPAFAHQVILPVAQGQPGLVSGLISASARLILIHPALFNLTFVVIQLGIGVLFMFRKSVKAAIVSSLVWGTIVWSVGEGFGGIFSGHTLLLMGAPGAALIYMILGLGVWPKKRSATPAFWLAICWVLLWVSGGVYQLLPGQNTTTSLGAMISANTSDAPSWLATVDTRLASSLDSLGASSTTSQTMSMASVGPGRHNGYWLIIILAAVQIFVGVGVLMSGKPRKLAVYLGIVLSVCFWIFGQGVGGFYSGAATDPNSGPLFVLLGLAVLGSVSQDNKLGLLGAKIENLLLGREKKPEFIPSGKP